ncbi:MAG: Pseudouridine synthase [uncultured bacterium]|nr:MAG: Pseudouridine synthase [uncultured bacterium]
MTEKIRLQKFMSQAGVASRRKAEELIRDLRVEICDREKCSKAQIGDKIDPAVNQVKVDGQIIESNQKLVYYAVNKPVGYTSSVRDNYAEKLVTELVPSQPKVWPVGRLDRDSVGLMVLTNDGELTNKLTHPRYRHEKEYLLKIQIPICQLADKSQTPVVETNIFTMGQVNPKSKIQKLKKGVILTEGIARFDKLEIINIDEERNIVTIKVVLHQGWKRQIRRMCEKVGLFVLELKRTRISKLELGDIEVGKYKIVSKLDII